MTEKRPLSRAEEWVGFHIGRASTGADAAEFIFDEEFADKRLAEAKAIGSALDPPPPTPHQDENIGHTGIFVEHQNALGMAHHHGEC